MGEGEAEIRRPSQVRSPEKQERSIHVIIPKLTRSTYYLHRLIDPPFASILVLYLRSAVGAWQPCGLHQSSCMEGNGYHRLGGSFPTGGKSVTLMNVMGDGSGSHFVCSLHSSRLAIRLLWLQSHAHAHYAYLWTHCLSETESLFSLAAGAVRKKFIASPQTLTCNK